MTDIFKPKESMLQKVERGLQKMENELFEESNKVVMSAVSHTFDIDPANPDEIPAAWLDEMADDPSITIEQIRKRQRIAKAAWMPPKEAPVALQIAAKVLGGMQKARAMQDQGPKSLNLTMVSISAEGQVLPVFPEKEVKHE